MSNLPDPTESMAQLGGVQQQQRQGEVLSAVVEVGDPLSQPEVSAPDTTAGLNTDETRIGPVAPFPGTRPDPEPIAPPQLPGRPSNPDMRQGSGDADDDGDDEEGEGATGTGDRPIDIAYPNQGEDHIDYDYYEEHKDDFDDVDYSEFYNPSNNYQLPDGTTTNVPIDDARTVYKLLNQYKYYPDANDSTEIPDYLREIINQDFDDINWNEGSGDDTTPYELMTGWMRNIQQQQPIIPPEWEAQYAVENDVDTSTMPFSQLLNAYSSSVNINDEGGFIGYLRSNQALSPMRNTPMGNFSQFNEMSNIPSEQWARNYKTLSRDEQWNAYVRANVGSVIAWNTRGTTHDKVQMRDVYQKLASQFTTYNLYLNTQYPSGSEPTRPDLPPDEPSIPDDPTQGGGGDRPVIPPPSSGDEPEPDPDPDLPDPGQGPSLPPDDPDRPDPEPEPTPTPTPSPEPYNPSKPIPSGFMPELLDDDQIDPSLKDDMDEMDLRDFIDIKKRTIEDGKVEYEMTETYKDKRLIIYDVGQLASKQELENFWKQTLTQAGMLIGSGTGLFSNIMQWVGLGNNVKSNSNLVSRSASLLLSHSQDYNWLGPEMSFGAPKNLLDCISAIHDAEYMLSGTHTHDADMDFINRCQALKDGFIMGRYSDEDTGEVIDYTMATNMSMMDLEMIDTAKQLIEQKERIEYSDSKIYKWLGLSKKDQDDSGMTERDFLLNQLNKARHELHDVKEESEDEQFKYFKLKQKQTQSGQMIDTYQKIILSILRNEPLVTRRQRIQMVINYLNQHSKAFSHSHMKDDKPQVISY